ncbi:MULTISPECIES: UDP-N-acetylmuramoyl-tripeptide--D-alanyl-D-alanine ligase [Clostridium]|uniref:UDP-N-acetylmuramoyl-tripeptide--D-alanyl-D-alanine ligase n=1 Tax=Clostridium senegalense TaxID=1465809 RepID=A0A6M0H087_9CLOT|nr:MULTISPECIES: UDP-N-acetylmuramoyl-tripeptide--D-alanyl-D-alanine ligase [Clostridium]NEU03534.1 UDP-N-acetylmuramoyl-tripeptide--D-alanyl-D-alanine ligase [Clostridium senegalense]
MEYLSINEIVNALNGKLILNGNIENFKSVSIDSRKVRKGDIFFALKGENFDGHNYLKQCSENGAGILIVHDENFKKIDIKEYTSVILVEDTRKALRDLAEYYRKKINIKVVGITGSTGKTSTKDLVAAALSEKYKVFKTKGNFNNEVGLPLMVFDIDNSYDMAVLELGMSNLNEIHRLTKIARPDIAVITNVGISHIENLKTRENILKAKMEIVDFFEKGNVLIVNGDNDLLSIVTSNDFIVEKIGIESDYNFKACDIIIGEENIKFNVLENNSLIDEKFKINVLGKHNVLNSLLAIAVARKFDVKYSDINKGFENLEATSMRLDIEKCNKFTIVNDAYNASPDSMEAAIDVLKNLNGKRKIAVLGSMKELGDESYKAHMDVAKYAKNNSVDMLLVISEYSNAFEEGFGDNNFNIFTSKEEAINFLKNNIQDEDVLLVKASRSMKFEIIVDAMKEFDAKGVI